MYESIGQLLLTYEYLNGGACEVPAFTYLVFKEALVRLLDILRKVGVKDEGGNLCIGDLRALLYLDIFTLDGGWGIRFNERKHLLVELRCADMVLTCLADFIGHLQHFEDTLLSHS